MCKLYLNLVIFTALLWGGEDAVRHRDKPPGLHFYNKNLVLSQY